MHLEAGAGQLDRITSDVESFILLQRGVISLLRRLPERRLLSTCGSTSGSLGHIEWRRSVGSGCSDLAEESLYLVLVYSLRLAWRLLLLGRRYLAHDRLGTLIFSALLDRLLNILFEGLDLLGVAQEGVQLLNLQEGENLLDVVENIRAHTCDLIGVLEALTNGDEEVFIIVVFEDLLLDDLEILPNFSLAADECALQEQLLLV